ncbi:TIGR04282 family arsenosugar biosynthesis glycosyltransferase [Novosphingopyxis sp.]|uniref:TIGR04282 family arsenosugar biosynthesis glycosyltransferase n=1 Tax=Novosphingopyxis sp. TaxID=2709690 RepID=UPI003B58B4A7
MTPAHLTTVHLFAKFPAPGRVKTRLIPALGAAGAAMLHRRLTERTVDAMRTSGLPFAVRTSGADASAFAEWLGDDVPLIEQGGGDLGARMGRAAAPAVLLGADVPDLSAAHIRAAAEAIETAPVAIGPAEDGGYYAVAFAQPLPFLWTDMDWGTDRVLAETLRRLETERIDPVMLEPLADCDRPEDLERWPWLTR